MYLFIILRALASYTVQSIQLEGIDWLIDV